MELDATTQVDLLIQNYEPSMLILWITLGVIVVALIALGSEFWVNLWGMIFSPSLTFQRLCGEAQWVPGVVVVAVAGMASAAIVLAYFANPVVVENMFEKLDPASNPTAGQIYEQMDNIFDQIGSDFSLMGNVEYVQTYAFQTQSIAMALPVAFLIIWLLWGLAGQLSSMIAGNKAGHGLTNLWSSLPYTYIIGILSTWFLMMMTFGNTFAKVMYIITTLYFLFVHVVLMREHGRYDLGKAIVSTILTIILTIIFVIVFAFIIAFIIVQVGNFL